MGRRRASFKVAPGVRISASSRGIRTSIGNSSGRVSFGGGQTYTSAKIAGVRVSQYHSAGGRRQSGSTSRPTLTQLQRAEKTATLEAQIAELALTEHQLVTLHHEDFPPAVVRRPDPPIPTDTKTLSSRLQSEAVKKISIFKRAARKAAKQEAHYAAVQLAQRQDAENAERHRELVAQAHREWESLTAHDPDHVIVALEEAFADNTSEATCVDAGIDNGRRYATTVIVFGSVALVPDRTPSTTPSGKPITKKRTKSDRNALYVQALGSTVLATVKEAFAVAPSLDEARIVVLRRDPEAATSAAYLTVIYSAEFDRVRTQALPWTELNPGTALLVADEANLQRKGAAGDVAAVDISHDPELATLVTHFAAALTTSS